MVCHTVSTFVQSTLLANVHCSRSRSLVSDKPSSVTHQNSSVVTSLSNYFYERFLLYIFIAFKINDSYVKEKVAGHGGVHP